MPTPTLFTPRLTHREVTVLKLTAAGWEAPEVAFLAGVEESDLPVLVASVLEKLDVDSLDHAITVAALLGIVRRADAAV